MVALPSVKRLSLSLLLRLASIRTLFSARALYLSLSPGPSFAYVCTRVALTVTEL